MMRDFDFVGWLSQTMGKGPWKCRCGVAIDHPGVCDPCGEKLAREQAEAPVRTAVESIPPRFRWARFDAEQLRERVRPVAAVQQAIEATDLLSSIGQSVVIIGPAGSGKTSLACAILRAVAMRRGGHAWRCRFAAALEIGAARGAYGTRSPLESDAIAASCLLLDDVGQETEADRIHIAEVLHARHDAERPTIVTSAFEPPVIHARYGGGVDRRIFEGASLIFVGGQHV
ncbi:MAG TPA: hypothetical protein DEB56_11165 [Thiobacillus sp.]|nr:hypothetical protein [Thiobacillus sp.]